MHAEMPSWPTHSFRAMGSQITLWVEADATSAAAAFAEAEALFATNERALSRFDTTSELCALNRQSGTWFAATPLLWDVVMQAIELAGLTDGLFDPTLLNALEAAGYTRSFVLMQAAGNPADAAADGPSVPNSPSQAWAAVALDRNRQAIKVPAGVRLDLGGIGKGYTAQQCVRLLAQWGPALVDAGGDLVAGAAPHGLPGWPVAVAAPSATPAGAPAAAEVADDLLQLWLAKATLATSGIDYRRWQHDGQWRHHLIDPRTGEPAVTDLITATVYHRSAVDAEAWAKVALLLGITNGMARLTEERIAGALAGVDGQVQISPAMAALTGTPTTAEVAHHALE
ncbi:MAG: FAD:protein FMN transferase [Caldilineaceae bacterium]